jgi:CRISPR-associated endonuclease/helicase Cas3
VLDQVREKLKIGQTCRVVSTQVIEAGVDLDFPLVLRAVGPLDSIIQAAGRCNREGHLERGRVIVFEPEGGGTPQGSYRTATNVTRSLLGYGNMNPDDPAWARRYFQLLFQSVVTDREGIQELRRSLDYPEVARKFQMIEPTETVVIPNYGTPEQRRSVQRILEQLRSSTPRGRDLLRRLQPFVVSVYQYQLPSLQQSNLIAEVMSGLYEWRGAYDDIRGIGGVTSLDPDTLVA